MASDGLAVLNHLGWTGRRSVHICGLSMGGMITQELALLDTERFASISLVSTSPGGLNALKLYAMNLPSGLWLLKNVFTAKSPRDQLDSGLQVLYPKSFLERTHIDEKTGEEKTNYRKYRRVLIERGMKGIAEGLPPFRVSSAVKQALAVATHRVSTEKLCKLGEHFDGAALVVAGDQDILVNHENAEVLGKPLGAFMLRLCGAGHGANEQYRDEVNAAIYDNIMRGERVREIEEASSVASRL